MQKTFVKTASRRNYSFSKSFLAPADLAQFAKLWSTEFHQSVVEYKRGQICGAELCARIVLRVHTSLFNKNWKNGARSETFIFPVQPQFTALNILGQVKIRSLPETAALAILRWGKGDISLKLFESLPSPLDVLALQSQGIRCVSVFTSEADLLNFNHEGRDFYSFLIHDLIHAQLMTERLEDFAHQIKFAAWLKTEWATLSLNLSEEARRELEYMASDMNSHIIHLIKTFRSWVERHRPDLTHRTDWFRDYGLDSPSGRDEEFLLHWKKINLKGDKNENIELVHSELLEFWKRLPSPSTLQL